VVAGEAQGAAVGHHVHHQREHLHHARAPVHEVSQEHRLATCRWRHPEAGVAVAGPALVQAVRRPELDLVAKRAQQRGQLREAAVHVADDVERPAQLALVVPQWLPLDGDGIHLLGRAQLEDVPEALSSQAPQRTAQLADLVAQHVRAEVAIRALSVALVAGALRQI
jgi:hypothetical protein